MYIIYFKQIEGVNHKNWINTLSHQQLDIWIYEFSKSIFYIYWSES